MKHNIAAFFCAMIILGLSAAYATADGEQEKLQIAEPIQEYTSMDLSPYRGKALFLNFFTEWCPYCMQEMDSIREIHEQYDPEAFQVILVHVWDGEDASNTESIKRRFGMQDMTFYEDEKAEVFRALGFQGYPTSLFLDQEGFLSQYHSGPLSREAMASAVESMGVTRLQAGEGVQ
ncbi:MAG: TlpA family protein disulfide reductase [Clostridia bacterium]|nr:TlpA family protein disulfide reductase [Clostridia bacterium]